MNKALVPVLLVCAAAIGGFFWWNSGDGDPALQPHAPIGDTGTAQPASATPTSGSLAATAAATPGSATSADAARVLAPDAPAPAASGIALRGRIVDGKGAPRAGVELRLDTWQFSDEFEVIGVPIPPPPNRRDDAAGSKYTTRNDGTFVIPLAKNQGGTLLLPGEDLVFARDLPMVDARKGDQDLGDVVVLNTARVCGVVQDELGKPVAGVRVALTIGSMGLGTSSTSTSKEDGTFSLGKLRPGTWSLRTASGKYLPTTQELVIAAEEQRDGVVLVVKPGNAIAGQVVDDRGVGVANMKVGSKRTEARGTVDIERFTPDEAVSTDANGYFTLAGLAEKSASVRAFGPGHTPASASDVPVGTGNLVLRVERLGIVEGVLLGSDGAPVAGSEVSADAGGGGVFAADGDMVLRPPGANARAVTAADGTFRLESVPPGTVTISATGRAHRPARQSGVQVQPAQVTKGVRLTVDRGATARIRVTDENGKAIADAKVRAERDEANAAEVHGGATFRSARRVRMGGEGGAVAIGNDEPVGSATTDAEGYATLAGLPAGELTFAAKHADFAPAEAAKLTVPKGGSVEGALTLRTPGQATLRVLGSDGAPLAGAQVVVEAAEAADGGDPRRVTTGSDGTAQLATLAPGAYTAALARSPSGARVGDAMVVLAGDTETIGTTKRPFTVMAGQTAEVELQRPVLTRVHGIVTGANGPAAGCALQLSRNGEGDFELPGIGGRSIAAGDDGTFAFDEVEPGPYVISFGKSDQVVKARHEFEVPANLADLRQDLSLRTGTLRLQVVAKSTNEGVEKAEVELVRAEEPTSSGPAPRRPQRVMMMTLSMTNDGNDPGGGETTMMTMGAQRTRTDEDGVAVIEDVPVGSYTVRITHRKQAPVELPGTAIAEGQTRDLGRIAMDAAGLIRGKVTAADGKPVGMAMVQSRPIERATWGEPTMAQGGSYRIQGLAAGKYKVRAQDLMAPDSFGPEVEVEVKAGETSAADLQLPAN